MNLSTVPENPAFALHLAELLELVPNRLAQQQLDAGLRADAGSLSLSVHQFATLERPAFYAAMVPTHTVVLVSGCEAFAHSSGVVIGYQGGIGHPIAEPVNVYFRHAADAIFGTLSSLGYFASPKILLVGHSLGGAVCEHLADALAQVVGPTNLSICTFGAPAPGGELFALNGATFLRARWFCSDDPVPLLPPTPGTLPAILLAYSVSAIQRFANFVQPAGGLEISPDATIREAILPGAAVVNATGSLAGWLLAIDGSSSSAHHLTTYRSRLAYWLQQHQGENLPLPGKSPAGSKGLVNSKDVRRQEHQLGQVVAELSRTQNLQGTSIPPEDGFKYQRLGRVHVVTLHGATVCVTSRERSARAFAREANEWLRSLQKQAVVNVDELKAQLAAYFGRASESGTGFLPVMNTQLPPSAS